MGSIDREVERYLRELAEVEAWLAETSAPRPPRRPGLTLPADDPSWSPTYVVRRWFTHDNQRAERDEIVVLGRGFWASLPDPAWLVEDGFLERLAERTHALRCGCRRLWGTADAFRAHGCAELPPVEQRHQPDGEEPTLAGKAAVTARCCGIRHRGTTHEAFVIMAARLERVYSQCKSLRVTARRVKDGPRSTDTIKRWIQEVERIRLGT
jgi:hypothetical protein